MKKVLILSALALAALPQLAHAQRDKPSREDRREQRQQANENLTPEQRRENFQSRMQERLKSMTPEQRTQFEARRAEFQQRMKDAGIDPNDPEAMKKARDSGLFNGMGGGMGGGQGGGQGGRGNRATNDAMKQMMEAAGITDFDVQDAIVAYVAEQNKARASLFQLAQTAASALQTPVAQDVAADAGDAQSADEKVAATFNAYQTALAAEKARQETALKALDEKIHYSTTPRIKAFLTLVGILDNDVLALGGPAAIFPAPVANAAPQDVDMQP